MDFVKSNNRPPKTATLSINPQGNLDMRAQCQSLTVSEKQQNEHAINTDPRSVLKILTALRRHCLSATNLNSSILHCPWKVKLVFSWRCWEGVEGWRTITMYPAFRDASLSERTQWCSLITMFLKNIKTHWTRLNKNNSKTTFDVLCFAIGKNFFFPWDPF